MFFFSRRAFVSLLLLGALASYTSHAKPSRAGDLLSRLQRIHHASRSSHDYSDVFHRSLQEENASTIVPPSENPSPSSPPPPVTTSSPTPQPSEERGATTEVFYIDTNTGIDPNAVKKPFEKAVVEEHSLKNSQEKSEDPEIMGMDAKIFAGVLVSMCALIIGAAAYRIRVTYVEGTGRGGQMRRPGGLTTIEVREALGGKWCLM